MGAGTWLACVRPECNNTTPSGNQGLLVVGRLLPMQLEHKGAHTYHMIGVVVVGAHHTAAVCTNTPCGVEAAAPRGSNHQQQQQHSPHPLPTVAMMW